MAVTHSLESRGQASSAGLKRSEARQSLTNWRAEDRRRQQARNAARHGSHSLPGEPRTGVISRLETQRGTAATHGLESRGQASSAGLKRSEARQPLTSWRAEDRHPRHGSHSRTGEPRAGVVSRLETQRGTAVTHFLESRGQASSAGLKRSEARQPLTSWRAKDGRPTHQLESQGQASSAGLKRSEARQSLTNWRAEDRHRQQAGNAARHGSHSLPAEPRTGVVSKLETQRGTAVTHFLESRGQASSAGLKRSEARQPLTGWRAEDRRQPRTGVVSRLETQRGTAATHSLESRGQASSAGLKRSEAWQPLTGWRPGDRRHQQAWNAAMHGRHSRTGEQSTSVVRSVYLKNLCDIKHHEACTTH
ncbi:hypothetical protein BJY52DRAFT_1420590 [Lactarius psammicola]|nr:hypothetical protein BJY52DRAFT_1420590 [Lactarius psammicola]